MSYTEVCEKGQGGFARVVEVRDEAGNHFAKKIYNPQKQITDAVGDEHLDLTRFNGHTSITQRGEPCQLTKRESEPSSTATTSR